jgi:hypothetical protein
MYNYYTIKETFLLRIESFAFAIALELILCVLFFIHDEAPVKEIGGGGGGDLLLLTLLFDVMALPLSR